ncbi:MAG TPA: xanthine dehydrogenase family protein subunit M [Azospirillaceae bacterium]|nr:xanthine dehydrogenase family protein subunit M [Azospirillaceae bacterium]
MYNFAYHRPATVAEAVALMGNMEDGRFLAGGQTLIPTMKQRLASPSDLIDLSHIPEMKGIREDGDAIVIGAFTCHADVARSEMLHRRLPALSRLAESIGDPHVRNQGTLGGSIANNDPAADYPGAVLGLEATVKTDRREIAADDFFTGMFETALEPGEIVVSVRFPVPEKACYAKFPNPASRYSMAGAFVAKFANAVRVAITGAGPTVFRIPDMEAALMKSFAPEALDGIEIDPDGLNNDMHGSAEYRANLVKVMARRAVEACA